MGQELRIGQALRLKGRPTADEVAAATRLPVADVEAGLAAFVDAGRAVEKNGRVRLTPEGKEHVAGLLAQERAELDHDGVEAAHERFLEVNQDFKALASDWQQRDGEPNDHTDADYDAAVLARLDEIDARLRPVLDDVVGAVPRLAPYAERFAAALDAVRGGDHRWFLHPLCDSYHTVWFELHEELIVATGRNRADEAAAGRGA